MLDVRASFVPWTDPQLEVWTFMCPRGGRSARALLQSRVAGGGAPAAAAVAPRARWDPRRPEPSRSPPRGPHLPGSDRGAHVGDSVRQRVVGPAARQWRGLLLGLVARPGRWGPLTWRKPQGQEQDGAGGRHGWPGKTADGPVDMAAAAAVSSSRRRRAARCRRPAPGCAHRGAPWRPSPASAELASPCSSAGAALHPVCLCDAGNTLRARSIHHRPAGFARDTPAAPPWHLGCRRL
ncbi:hypothetical protein HPB50_003490 [Hyalomma asiaticum]|uniref:Uncharacterized protein n=1 Tax=Hyalomma asiaticum TaxID=266040 RepID=A0ACB7SEH1_HYAAI|nr:hypothetical protein HPB50_003490 [Hyalomma asiaticum]